MFVCAGFGGRLMTLDESGDNHFTVSPPAVLVAQPQYERERGRSM